MFVNHLLLWLGEEDDPEAAAHHLKHQRQIIEGALAREGSGGVFEKWKWLADMHNHVLSAWPEHERYVIDAGQPVHSFRSFLSTL